MFIFPCPLFYLDTSIKHHYSGQPLSEEFSRRNLFCPVFVNMSSGFNRKVAILLSLLALAGCAKPLIRGKSLLSPPRMSPDSCVLDVFFVRVPFGDPKTNEELWQEIDERQFPADLRERLMRNGFRAGTVDGQIPIAISNLLELSDKPAPTSEVTGTNLTDLNTKPHVTRQHMQVRAGRPSQIVVSGTYEELAVLLREPGGGLSGETYDQAQGIFNLKILPLSDGRVRLDMAPEIHHDQPRQRRVEDQGLMRLDYSRPKRVFEDMTLSATLSPGGMLVMTCLPDLSGSLGHHFFTENDGRLEQKFLVIRLSQTQHDGLFVMPEELSQEGK
jgi:hypothetical protein